MVAARIANLKAGDNQHKKQVASIDATCFSIDQAAGLMSVSAASVDRAKRVLRPPPSAV
jgi:hypothetical protein